LKFRSIFISMILSPQMSFTVVDDLPPYTTVGPAHAVVLSGSPKSQYIIYLHGYAGIRMTAFEIQFQLYAVKFCTLVS
jgi:hypothetical protein